MEMICRELRAADRAEIYNLRSHDSWVILAREAYVAMAHMGRGAVVWLDGLPQACIGFAEIRPGVYDAISFGTDRYRECGVALMRMGRRLARDLLTATELGAHRLQADARADNTEAHKFIRILGGKLEGPPMRAYGRDGSDYQRFVWLRADGDAKLVGLEA